MAITDNSNYQQGHIKRWWAETFDSSMGAFMLLPMDPHDCHNCQFNHVCLSQKRTKFNFLKFFTRIKTKARSRFFLWVIRWLERVYIGSDEPDSSQIIDGCLAIREGLYGSPD